MNNDNEYLKVNYLPYPKGNRDEWIRKNEVIDRLAGPFVHSLSIIDKDKENI